MLLDPQKSHYTADELTKGVEGSLTTGALNSWRNRVNKALAGDEDAVDALDGLQLYSIKEPTWQVPTNGKLIVSQLLTNVVVDAENDTKNVIVTMHHRTVAHYETDEPGRGHLRPRPHLHHGAQRRSQDLADQRVHRPVPPRFRGAAALS